jgi:hypothetical protein
MKWRFEHRVCQPCGMGGKSSSKLGSTQRARFTVMAVFAVSAGLALYLAKGQGDQALSTGLAVVGLGLAAGSAYIGWVAYISGQPELAKADPARLADQLAISVRLQWQAEASMRRLNEPYPLSVSWSAADPVLADRWDVLATLARTGAGWPEPRPNSWANGPAELAGHGNELSATLAKVPTGRLVVLGEPGSGKTTLMIRLALDMLMARQPGRPVPFVVPLASWDPAEDLRSWLAGQLAVSSTGDRPIAEALIEAGLIMPFLDGLDEVPAVVRGLAISQINDGLRPGEVAVLTCRTDVYNQSITEPRTPAMRFRAAAAIRLDPLTIDVVSDYLVADAGGPSARERWAPVLRAMESGAPAGRALRTPFMATMARAIYNPRPDEPAGVERDPSELCSGELTSAEAVEAHLLDALIPASYRGASRWTAKQAGPWLAFLAHHLEVTIGGVSLAWWLLRQSTPFADHDPGPPGRFHRTIATPTPLARLRLRPQGVVLAILTGSVTGTGAGFLSAAGGVAGVTTLSQARLVGESTAIVMGSIIFLAFGFMPVRRDLGAATRPRKLVRTDRRMTLIAMFTLAVGAAASLVLMPDIWNWPVTLTFAFALGFVLVGLTNPWPAYVAASAYLALRKMLPWHLMDFLEDAHERGVLRQAGAVYQFRHIELQRQLARNYQEPDVRWWMAPLMIINRLERQAAATYAEERAVRLSRPFSDQKLGKLSSAEPAGVDASDLTGPRRDSRSR